MRSTSSRSSFSPSILLLAVSAMTAGCIDGTIPLPLTLPSMTVDLDAPRLALEERLCLDEASPDCAVLADLDASDGARVRPFTLPEIMPNVMRVSPTRVVDVPRWFADVQQRAMSGEDVQAIVAEQVGEQAGPIDDDAEDAVEDVIAAASTPWLPRQLLPLEIDAAALDRLSERQLAELTIQRADVVVDDNSLSVDLPAIEIWLGNGLVMDESGAQVPADRSTAKHIASSAVVSADDDGVANIEFAAGAVAALIEALRGEQAWIELVAADKSVALLPGERADTLRRPGGAATLTVDLALGIPVSVGSLMELNSRGTEGLDDL